MTTHCFTQGGRAHSTGAEMTRRPWESGKGSDLCELAGVDQLHQHVPLILLEHGEIAGFSDPYLVPDNLNIGTLPAAGRAQCHFERVHAIHPLPFTTDRPSMQAQTAAARWRLDRHVRSNLRSCPRTCAKSVSDRSMVS